MTLNNGDRSLRSVAIVIAAAGSGSRFQGDVPKALAVIEGTSLLAHCLNSVMAVSDLGVVVVAAPQSHMREVAAICDQFGDLPLKIATGGVTRSESVRNAISVLPPEIDIVLVHDAARAFTPASMFVDVIEAVRGGAKAVIPGVPVVDTIKEVDEVGAVVSTVPRDSLRSVQTPQGFDRSTLVAVHRDRNDDSATDDAGMVEAQGGAVLVIPGHPEAFKVTTPFDRLVAQALIRSRSSPN